MLEAHGASAGIGGAPRMAAPKEVHDSDLSLKEAIDVGDVEAPDLMGYKSWLTWRSGPGLRPKELKSISG